MAAAAAAAVSCCQLAADGGPETVAEMGRLTVKSLNAGWLCGSAEVTCDCTGLCVNLVNAILCTVVVVLMFSVTYAALAQAAQKCTR
jgi:hypothetical protein